MFCPRTKKFVTEKEKGDTAIRREIRLIRDTRLAKSSDNRESKRHVKRRRKK